MAQEELGDWLPLWMIVGRWWVLPAGTFLTVCLLTRCAERLFARGPLPPQAPPWPLNAYAVHRLGPLPLLSVLLTGVAAWLLTAGGGVGLAPRGLIALVVLAAFAAAVCERRRLVARHGGLVFGWETILRTRLALLLLRWPLYLAAALLVLMRRTDPHPGVRFFLGLVLILALWFGGALLIARGSRLVRPAGERLRACVARVAARAGIPPPPAFELEMPFPNAFALWNGGVVVTSAALTSFEEPELEAVVAHELGHLSERRLLVLMTLPALVILVCALWAVTLASMQELWPWLALAATFLALRLVLPRFLQAAERRADAFAHAHASPTALARALEALHRAGLIPPQLGAHSTHPGLAERVASAGAETSPRSASPAAKRLAPHLVVALSGAFLLVVLLVRVALYSPDAGPWRARMLLTLRGPDSFALSRLAELELADDHPRAAHALFRAGALLEPANPWWTMQETVALLAAHDCAAARERLAESERRSTAFPPEESAEWYAWARTAVADCR